MSKKFLLDGGLFALLMFHQTSALSHPQENISGQLSSFQQAGSRRVETLLLIHTPAASAIQEILCLLGSIVILILGFLSKELICHIQAHLFLYYSKIFHDILPK